MQAGRASEAVGYFERAIAAGQRSAQLYSNLGIALVRTNREDEAIVAYREALTINPNNSVLRFTVGSLLLKREKFEEAIEEYRAGLALVPDSPEAHNNLGGALAATGRTAEAISEFEHALRLDPDPRERPAQPGPRTPSLTNLRIAAPHPATISETAPSKLARELSAGFVVNSTHVTWDSGSCQNKVPVDP